MGQYKNYMTKADVIATSRDFLERARFYNVVGDKRRAIVWLECAARWRRYFTANRGQ